MQLLVANEAGPAEAKPPVAEWRFGETDKRMPVKLDRSLSFAPPYRHIEAVDRHVEIERLNPLHRDA
jgi:hypothetical protein